MNRPLLLAVLVVCLTVTLRGQQSGPRTPEQTVRPIVERVMRETPFEFTTAEVAPDRDDGHPLPGSKDTAAAEWKGRPVVTVQELRVPKGATFTKDPYSDWQYANGTLMLGLLNEARGLADTAARSFVKRYILFTLDNMAMARTQYYDLHVLRGFNYRIFRRTMLDDSGGPVVPFAEFRLTESEPRLDTLLAEMADYVSKGQMRLGDGTLCRPDPEPETVWADDLFMSTPFLVRYSAVTGDPRFLDDAAGQALRFHHYLEDRQTGLYRHGWYNSSQRQAPYAWGRANGWIVWATSEILSAMPKSHPLRDSLAAIFRHHLASLVKYQAASGRWHQVLDHPESYEETSCTAMYIIGMARGLMNGILEPSFSAPLEKAWAGLQERISADGIVKDICRGTGMSNDLDFYKTRERYDNDPRGLGAVITACVEMHRYFMNEKESR